MRRVFIYSLATLLLLVPTLVLAADPIFEQSIVPECNGMCQVCDLVKLANNILQFMVAASVLIATLMFAYAGFLYITATSSPKNIGTAKSIFQNVFTGLVLILTAWLIVDLILSVFTGKNIGFYSEIQCVEYVPSKDGWQVSDAPPVPSTGSVSGGGWTPSNLKTDAFPSTISGVYVKEGVPLNTLSSTAQKNIESLQKSFGADIVVTSTTDGTHKQGECSHSSGCKYDLRSDPALVGWIKNNYTYSGLRSNDNAPKYTDSCGNICAFESDHIDCTANNLCGSPGKN